MRECVKWFGEQMESALSKHDKDRGEEGWLDEDLGWLFDRLVDEVDELEEVLETADWQEGVGQDQIIKECVDVANFAMFIADVTRNS